MTDHPRRQQLTRRAALGLGVLYVVLGIAETVRVLVTGDGGLVFWFGTLVGGGALLLFGVLSKQVTHTGRRRAVVIAGAALGMPATAWTLVVPLLALAVIGLTVAAIVDAADEPIAPAS